MNDDGRLDLFVANQDGTLNGLFRNDGSRFVDVADELGMDAGGRPANFGSNGPSVVDYDNDGRLDLFVAGYGRNFLFHNDGNGRFTEVAAAKGVAGGDKATPSAWGDYDNDGRPDLYVSSYVDRPVNERDFLFHNDGGAFADAMPEIVAKHGATHGVQWVDFNGDGALDLALANNNPDRRPLSVPERAGRPTARGARFRCRWSTRTGTTPAPDRKCASARRGSARSSAAGSSTPAAATARRA